MDWLTNFENTFHTKQLFFFSLLSLIPETSRLTRFVKPLADQMSSTIEYQEIQNLTTSNVEQFEKASLGVKQALEVIEINTQWQLHNYNDISTYLRKFSSDDDEVVVWFFIFFVSFPFLYSSLYI